MDQAAALRATMRDADVQPYGGGSRVPAIVVGSGKGGVGKSILSVLLARSMAASGARVLLVDGDDELANLHILLGHSLPASLGAVLDGEASVADLIVPVAERLWFCAGSSGSSVVRQSGPLDRGRMFNRIVDCFVDYDVVLIDAGAGVESALRACTIGGTNLLMVTTPDPAALTDAFAVMKLVMRHVPGFPIDLAINRALSPVEGENAARRLQIACHRFLNFECALRGVVPEDVQLSAHVRHGTSVLSVASENPAAAVVERIAQEYQARVVRSDVVV